MSRSDWFRSTEWTPQVRAAFLGKLERCRKASRKAQYARIQALYLQEDIGTQYALHEAIDLLTMVCERWPEQPDKQSVLGQLATCHVALGRITEGISFFRSSFAARRKDPGIQTMHHLDFSLLVASEPFPDLFGEALAVLEEFPPAPFPYHRFQYYAAIALIYHQLKLENADSLARFALQEAAATHSGSARHPDFCLGAGKYASLVPALEEIAA